MNSYRRLNPISLRTVAHDAIPPRPEDFPRIRIRECVSVHFQSEDKKDRVWVLLDQSGGKFIAGWSDINGQKQGQIKEP